MRRILEMLFPWRDPRRRTAFHVEALLYNGKHETLPVQFGTRSNAARDVLMRWRKNMDPEIVGYVVINDKQEAVFAAPASSLEEYEEYDV